MECEVVPVKWELSEVQFVFSGLEAESLIGLCRLVAAHEQCVSVLWREVAGSLEMVVSTSCPKARAEFESAPLVVSEEEE